MAQGLAKCNRIALCTASVTVSRFFLLQNAVLQNAILQNARASRGSSSGRAGGDHLPGVRGGHTPTLRRRVGVWGGRCGEMQGSGKMQDWQNARLLAGNAVLRACAGILIRARGTVAFCNGLAKCKTASRGKRTSRELRRSPGAAHTHPPKEGVCVLGEGVAKCEGVAECKGQSVTPPNPPEETRPRTRGNPFRARAREAWRNARVVQNARVASCARATPFRARA
jgi:hypothetical protein